MRRAGSFFRLFARVLLGSRCRERRNLETKLKNCKMEAIKNIKGIENIESSFPGITKEIDDLIERANNRFTQGFMCAMAAMMYKTGESTPLTETVSENFTTISDLVKQKVAPEDIETLRPIFKEINRKRKLSAFAGNGA